MNFLTKKFSMHTQKVKTMFDIYNEEAYHPTAVDQQCGDHLYTHRFSTNFHVY
jgi:hypothetical protein